MSDVITASHGCAELWQDHEDRIAHLERGQADLMREIVAVRAEGSARDATIREGMSAIQQGQNEITRTISEHMGAEKERERAEKRNLERDKLRAEDSLRNLKKFATVITIIGTLFAALFSWQEIASYVWVKELHLQEPWDAQPQSGGNQ